MPPASRLVPTSWQTRRATSGESRERLDELRGPRRPREQVAQHQQPEVRVGGGGQPVEDEREQLLHHPARAVEAARQLVDGDLGARRVGEAERGEPRDRGLRAERSARGGERLEQGPEVHALVDRAHGELVVEQVVVELLAGGRGGPIAVAEHAGQLVELVAVGRHGVHLLLVAQLDPVLDRPQEAVRVRERGRVARLDVPRDRHLVQRGQGVRRAQVDVGVAVDELQQLDGELDVADAAAPPLDVAVGQPAARDLGLGTRLHPTEGAEVLGRERVRPEPALRGVGEQRAQLLVAAGRRGLEERLELPRLRPAVPVRLVRVDRADQRTVPALRSEVGVEAEAAPGDGGHRPGAPLGDVRRAVADEEHVDVARVVELVAAELAHADHRELRVPGVTMGVTGLGEQAGAVEDVGGEVRERRRRAVDRVEPEQVPRGDAQQLEPVPRHQAVGRVVVAGAADPERAERVERRGRGRLDRARERAAGREDRDERGRHVVALGESRRDRRVAVDERVERLADARRCRAAVDRDVDIEGEGAGHHARQRKARCPGRREPPSPGERRARAGPTEAVPGSAHSD